MHVHHKCAKNVFWFWQCNITHAWLPAKTSKICWLQTVGEVFQDMWYPIYPIRHLFSESPSFTYRASFIKTPIEDGGFLSKEGIDFFEFRQHNFCIWLLFLHRHHFEFVIQFSYLSFRFNESLFCCNSKIQTNAYGCLAICFLIYILDWNYTHS